MSNENEQNKCSGDAFEKFAVGVFVLRAENANFNADFSGFPRTLPSDSSIYATDKALKYCIRKYWHDILDNQEQSADHVLLWRRYGEDGTGSKTELFDIDNNIEKLPFLKGTEDIQGEIFKKCLDIRCFGGTLTLKNDNSFSITGPIQISYGLDCYTPSKSKIYVDQILSPKPNNGENKVQKQFTTGSQVRATEVHYAYDITINPNNLSRDERFKGKDNCKLAKNDICKFKEGLTRGVNYTTSCTKAGTAAEFFIYIEFKEEKGRMPLVPILNRLVQIKETKQSGISEQESDKLRREIDLSKLFEHLEHHKERIESIEMYYDPTLLKEPNDTKLKTIEEEKDVKPNSMIVSIRHILCSSTDKPLKQLEWV